LGSLAPVHEHFVHFEIISVPGTNLSKNRFPRGVILDHGPHPIRAISNSGRRAFQGPMAEPDHEVAIEIGLAIHPLKRSMAYLPPSLPRDIEQNAIPTADGYR
jgi:hypothetical protein